MPWAKINICRVVKRHPFLHQEAMLAGNVTHDPAA
jgi:hypothetical protein